MERGVVNTMGAKVSRGEKALADLRRDRVISHGGEQWLKQALDPFHDSLTTPCSYPDGLNAPTVTYAMKNQIEVSKPGALPAGNWDLHVFNLPATNPINLTAGVVRPANALQWMPMSTIPTGNFGYINATACPTGADTSIMTAAYNPSVSSYIESAAVTDAYRVVGWGFEVYNTTNKLSLQGLATCYRVPEAQDKQCYNGMLTTAPWTSSGTTHTFTRLGDTPANTAEALSFLGTRQWAAEEGAYVVVPMRGTNNPPRYAEPESIFFRDEKNNANVRPEALSIVTGGSPTQWSSTNSHLVPYQQDRKSVV